MKGISIHLFLLLFIILLFSCQKETSKPDVTYPQRLRLYSKSIKSQVRLITNKTEITDTSTINKFIKYCPVFNSPGQFVDTTVFITFISKGKASFYYNGSINTYSITNNGSQFLFYSDSLIMFYNTQTLFLNNCLKYSYSLCPLSNGTSYVTKDIRVGYGNYQEQEFSVFVYQYKIGNSNTNMGGGFYNEFNDNAISQIGSNDTLAFQSYTFKAKTY
jgi:hypothetical protein